MAFLFAVRMLAKPRHFDEWTDQQHLNSCFFKKKNKKTSGLFFLKNWAALNPGKNAIRKLS